MNQRSLQHQVNDTHTYVLRPDRVVVLWIRSCKHPLLGNWYLQVHNLRSRLV